MKEPQINIYKDNLRVAEALAVFLAFWLSRQERAAIALSGGSTPTLLFRHLAERYRDRIDWSKVHFFWGDERCVSPENADSNYGTARDLLFQHLPIPEGNIHRIRGEAEPAEEALRYGEEIRRHVPISGTLPSFDMILLGMGTDGHTASIFPDQMELLKSDSICAVARHPETGQQRISLTGPVINNGRQIIFLVTGAGKAEKVEEVIEKKGDWKDYPAAHIAPERGGLFWFLDLAAAGRLPEVEEGGAIELI
jgi:6-phosphogluconolactonase